VNYRLVWTLFLSLISISAFSRSGEINEREKKLMQDGDTPFPNPKIKMNEKSCGKVDLAAKVGPVHTQMGGTCYAYTALDLLNFGTSTRYSATYLAALKPYSPPPEKKAPLCKGDVAGAPSVFDEVGGFSGGNVSATIKLGMERGLCPESVLPSSAGVLKKDYQKLLEYYQKVNKSRSSSAEACQEDSSASIVDKKLFNILQEKFSSDSEVWKSKEVQREIQNMYPTLSAEKVSGISNSSNSSDELIKRLNEESCKGKLSKGIPPGKGENNIRVVTNKYHKGCSKFYYEEDREAILDLINKGMDSGNPVGVSYVTGGLIKQPKELGHSYHASIVAGRDWLDEETDKKGNVIRPGGCYYLIKNSWGEDWKVRDGLKAKSSELYPGYFVISEKQLMEHAYGATSID
jgi:hypothetical protein